MVDISLLISRIGFLTTVSVPVSSDTALVDSPVVSIYQSIRSHSCLSHDKNIKNK